MWMGLPGGNFWAVLSAAQAANARSVMALADPSHIGRLVIMLELKHGAHRPSARALAREQINQFMPAHLQVELLIEAPEPVTQEGW